MSKELCFSLEDWSISFQREAESLAWDQKWMTLKLPRAFVSVLWDAGIQTASESTMKDKRTRQGCGLMFHIPDDMWVQRDLFSLWFHHLIRSRQQREHVIAPEVKTVIYYTTPKVRLAHFLRARQATGNIYTTWTGDCMCLQHHFISMTAHKRHLFYKQSTEGPRGHHLREFGVRGDCKAEESASSLRPGDECSHRLGARNTIEDSAARLSLPSRQLCALGAGWGVLESVYQCHSLNHTRKEGS